MDEPIEEPADYRRQLVLGRPGVAGDAGGRFLYSADELLVRDAGVADLETRLAQMGVGFRKVRAPFGVTRYRVEPGALGDLVRFQASAGPHVKLNHVVTGSHTYTPFPNIHGGTFTFAWPDVDPGWALGQGNRGAGKKIAVLDTGLAMQAGHPEHPVLNGYRTLRGAPDAEVLDECDPQNRLDDEAGHGTFISGVLALTAPGADVVVTRVLDGDGVGDEFTVATRLVDLNDREAPDVVVLSLGLYTTDDEPPLALTAAIRSLDTAVVLACAGNAASDRPFWPAALPRVVAVAAARCSDGKPGGAAHGGSFELEPAPYSNHGPWVDVCAVGHRVSTFPMCTDAAWTIPGTTVVVGPRDFRSGWARWTGTSFSTPVVAAELAALLSGGMAPLDAVAHLKSGVALVDGYGPAISAGPWG